MFRNGHIDILGCCWCRWWRWWWSGVIDDDHIIVTLLDTRRFPLLLRTITSARARPCLTMPAADSARQSGRGGGKRRGRGTMHRAAGLFGWRRIVLLRLGRRRGCKSLNRPTCMRVSEVHANNTQGAVVSAHHEDLASAGRAQRLPFPLMTQSPEEALAREDCNCFICLEIADRIEAVPIHLDIYTVVYPPFVSVLCEKSKPAVC